MSCADIINSSGLFLDIVGVALLFLYGLPAEVRKTAAGFLTWGSDKGEDEKAARTYQHYKRMSRGGFACLVVGFTLQIISNFLS